jgi:hypothetical protein
MAEAWVSIPSTAGSLVDAAADSLEPPQVILERIKGSLDNVMPTHRECSKCRQMLPRHLFTKKKYKKPSASSSEICFQQCRRNETAIRCKQAVKPNVQQGRRNEAGIKRRPNNFGFCNYLDQLFSMRCFSDIVGLSVLNSAKDATESMAAIHAASYHGVIGKNNKACRVKCLCIGDGSNTLFSQYEP